MIIDRTTETIAHFIGLFDLTIENARLRDSYEQFTAHRREAELKKLQEPHSKALPTEELDKANFPATPLNASDGAGYVGPIYAALPSGGTELEPPAGWDDDRLLEQVLNADNTTQALNILFGTSFAQTVRFVDSSSPAPSGPGGPAEADVSVSTYASGSFLLPFPGSAVTITVQMGLLIDSDTLTDLSGLVLIGDQLPASGNAAASGTFDDLVATAEAAQPLAGLLPNLDEMPTLDFAEAFAQAMLSVGPHSFAPQSFALQTDAPTTHTATTGTQIEGASDGAVGVIPAFWAASYAPAGHAAGPDMGGADSTPPASETSTRIETDSAVFHGEDALGLFVNGEAAEEAPLWSDLLPEHHRDETPDEQTETGVASLDPRALPDEAGVNPDFEDGYSITAGGNFLVNQTTITTNWVDAPIIAVGGKWIQLDHIGQVAVASNVDTGQIPSGPQPGPAPETVSAQRGASESAQSGASEAAQRASSEAASEFPSDPAPVATPAASPMQTTVVQIAEITEESRPLERAEVSQEQAATGPKWVHIDHIEGDLLVSHHVRQTISVNDEDSFGMEIAASSGAYVLGDNTVFNITDIFAYGMTYDLIIVGGNFIRFNSITQTLVLEDNDTFATLPAPAPKIVPAAQTPLTTEQSEPATAPQGTPAGASGEENAKAQPAPASDGSVQLAATSPAASEATTDDPVIQSEPAATVSTDPGDDQTVATDPAVTSAEAPSTGATAPEDGATEPKTEDGEAAQPAPAGDSSAQQAAISPTPSEETADAPALLDAPVASSGEDMASEPAALDDEEAQQTAPADDPATAGAEDTASEPVDAGPKAAASSSLANPQQASSTAANTGTATPAGASPTEGPAPASSGPDTAAGPEGSPAGTNSASGGVSTATGTAKSGTATAETGEFATKDSATTDAGPDTGTGPVAQAEGGSGPQGASPDGSTEETASLDTVLEDETPDPDGMDPMAELAEDAEPATEAAPDNLLVNEAHLSRIGIDKAAELTESLSDIVRNTDQQMEMIRAKLMEDPVLAGIEYARVLQIDGDLIQSRIIEQVTKLRDSDDIHLLGTAPDDLAAVMGQNALINAARATDIGIDSKIMAAEGAYTDLLIHQAKFIEEMDPGARADEIVSEAIAFLMDDNTAGSTHAGDGADSGRIHTAVDSDDLMASALT